MTAPASAGNDAHGYSATLRWWSVALLCAGFAPWSARADWQEDLTPGPGKFPPMRPQHAHYQFGWGALRAAEADFDLTRQKGGVSRLSVAARSTGVVRSTWRMNAEHVSNIRTATLRPISLDQTEVYKKESDKVRVDFTPEGAARRHESTPPEGKVKTKLFKFSDVYDLQGALQFIRSQPLAVGDVYKLVVYPGMAPYLCQVEVLGLQKIKAAGREFNALKTAVRLWKINSEDMQLLPHEKFKRANVWISDDPERLLLRVEAEIFVGSVWGELESVEMK